ncbi:signal peptidase I [Carboxylicivirga mesophila]|uniref:Signal peptidase I n=1 Tax=Carboxylicivirga mesophila TaxID=1166478 RepID=A0ABS5KG92_9BACT|nr:signal peptidase I [Carboxylicivirga mesophila]
MKAALQYLLIILWLLLAIWSQSWVLISLLCLVSILLWHPALKQWLHNYFNRIARAKVRWLEWLLALGISILFIGFVNTCAISFYTMQSSSMSPAHNINELIVINKLAYGPARQVNQSQKYRRLPGYSPMKHGDVIAFHFPEADTSFVKHVEENYHFVKRQYQTTKSYNPLLKAEVQHNPVANRKIFIKRLIALPGDTMSISNGEYFINNQRLACNALFIGKYSLRSSAPDHIKDTIRKKAHTTYRENGAQQIEIQRKLLEENNWGEYLNIEEETMNMPNTYVFPFQASYFWNASYMGPIIIPTKGKTVRLTMTNIPLYRRIIEAYEDNHLTIKDNTILINGKNSKEYTFKMNYYWVAGDNQKHSFDSRYWGFVPENHIIGRVEKLSDTK